MEHDGLSMATVSRRLTGVACWYAWMVDEGYVSANPTTRVRRPKVSTESTRTWLGRLELADWLAAAEAIGGYDHALACLLAINALRVGEVCRADVLDLSSDRHHRTLQIIGKGAKPAVVPLTPRTAHAVDEALGSRTDGPLLVSRGNSRMNREAAGRAVKRIAKKAGIQKVLTPHSLRHSAITAALNAGVDLRDVQQYARHSDPATTIRYDRSRLTLDRHPAYVVDIHISSGSG
jgi:integrase/recombinase XerD